jgi:hypothetical protein
MSQVLAAVHEERRLLSCVFERGSTFRKSLPLPSSGEKQSACAGFLPGLFCDTENVRLSELQPRRAQPSYMLCFGLLICEALWSYPGRTGHLGGFRVPEFFRRSGSRVF